MNNEQLEIFKERTKDKNSLQLISQQSQYTSVSSKAQLTIYNNSTKKTFNQLVMMVVVVLR